MRRKAEVARPAAGARARLLRAARRHLRARSSGSRPRRGHPYHTDTDLDVELGDIGLYAASTRSSRTWLALRGGVRADLFTYDVLNNCAVARRRAPVDDEPARRRELPDPGGLRPVPRAGPARVDRERGGPAARVARARPVRGLSPSLSYGQGVRSIDPSYITQDVKTPFAQIQSYEAGARVQGRARRRRHRRCGCPSSRRTSTRTSSSARPSAATSSAAARRAPAASLSGAAHRRRASTRPRTSTLVRSTFDDTGLLVPYVPDVVVRSDTSCSARCRGMLDGKPLIGDRRARRHLRRAAPAALRRAPRHDLHDRRLGVGCVGPLRARRSGDEPARHPVPARRVQLRLRLPQPGRADACRSRASSPPARRAPCCCHLEVTL